MSGDSNQILILHTDDNFQTKLRDMRSRLANFASFSPFNEESKDSFQKVLQIVNDVINIGDEAVARYTQEFDKVTLLPGQFRVEREQLAKAHKEIDKTLLASIRGAITNVKKFQNSILDTRLIKSEPSDEQPATIKYRPIKRVGIYIPGGSAPLGSTVIMTVVPALVAAVEQIVVVSPPRHNGGIDPVTLAVCWELGIDEVYRIGGAQAIAALVAEKTSIPKVDKIVGPGNRWVQTAKLLISGLAGIDCIAGPSEVLIIADENSNPNWVAIDMLAQVEHNPGVAFLFTDSLELAEKVLKQLKQQTPHFAGISNSINIAVFKNMDDAIAAANEFAPEHCQIQCGQQSQQVADKIENAGAIFIGDYTPVAIGDYWAGPSHTLPTGTASRFASGLNVYDFIKSTSIIQYAKEDLANSADDIIRLAKAEKLNWHAESIKIRTKN